MKGQHEKRTEGRRKYSGRVLQEFRKIGVRKEADHTKRKKVIQK
jgi:hypothetical protein